MVNVKFVVVSVMFMLLLSFSALGSTNVSVYMDTNGSDANVYAYPNTGVGTTNYYLDGKNFDHTVHDIKNDIPNDKKILETIWEVFMEYDYSDGKSGLVQKDKSDLWSYELKFRNIMESIFVTWQKFSYYYENERESPPTLVVG